MNKKGLSEVVTTVLIILLVLAAIIIIWTYVRPTIEKAARQVTGDCLAMDLEVQNCKNLNSTAGTANVTVKRGTADIDIQTLLFIFESISGDKKTVEDSTNKIDTLGVKTILVSGLSANTTKAVVSAKIKTQNGDIMTCQPTSTAVACS
jgi:hypothetical protein